MSVDLTEFITKATPLGPLNSDKIMDLQLIDALFSKKNLIYSELEGNPSLIVGRKGSGKTTFLRLTYLNPKYKIIVELRPEVEFRQIVQSIEGIGKGIVFTEEVCALWDMLFWNTIFANLLQESKKSMYRRSEHIDIVRKYAAAIGISDLSDPYGIMKVMIDLVKKYTEDNPISGIASLIERITFGGVTFGKARDAAIAFMKESSIRAAILLDNLDDFQLDKETMTHAISGFLRCQGSFGAPGTRCTIKCCLPAELYFPFLDLSSSPIKDFQNQVTLHWHAEELLRLAAERHLQYMRLYHQNAYKELARVDLSTRSGVMAYWEEIFPERLMNRVGIEEKTIAYILRHTQLLPRQLLTFLNAICKESVGESIETLKSRPNVIVKNVHDKDGILCDDIFSAYTYVYPSAKDACSRCISYLPLRFTEGDLRKVYNKHGRRLIGIHDFYEFKKMMMEIGSIGVVMPEKETERYATGLFEYTVEHRLISSSYDELCLHPLFSEVFSAIKPKDLSKVIYPFGSDINEPDWRKT